MARCLTGRGNPPILDPAVAGDASILDKVKALNPFGKVAEVLGKAAGPPPLVSKPVAPPTAPSGPGAQVDWVDPQTGKRMSGTQAEKDLALKKPLPTKPAEKPRAPTVPRALSRGVR